MASDLPWHYLPTWMGITTPLLYILFFLVGLFVTARYLWPSLTNESVAEAKLQDSFYTLMFFVPLATIILLNATLYDGWRHAFFIYPYFVVIATIGVVFIKGYFSRKKLGSKVFYSCCIGYFVWIGGWMVVNNPHQNLYFNILTGDNRSTRWEMDYWGLSNKYALEYILKNDPSSVIKLREISFTPLEVSGKILDTKARERLIFNVPIGDADYLVNNYRLTTKMVSEKETLGFNKVKDFKIDGEVFLTIYKRDTEKASGSGD
jgi:general stress protein CsbA